MNLVWCDTHKRRVHRHLVAAVCPNDAGCYITTEHTAACGHTVTDRQDLHWSDRLEDEVCPDCCEECSS